MTLTNARSDLDERPRAARALGAGLGESTTGGSLLAWRVGWTLAGLVLVNWSIQLLGSSTTDTWIVPLVVVSGLWGLATTIACWLPASDARAERWRLTAAATTAALLIACYLAWSFLQLHAYPAYGTDEIAYDQYAAVLAVHGLDPYTHSMLPAFARYHVSPDAFTYRLNGTPVTSLSYPALSFLVYVPFLLLGWSTQMAVGVNALAWAAGIVILFVALPRQLRPLGLVLGSVAAYSAYATGGVTDLLDIPLLMGAAWSWSSFARRQSWTRYLGPVLLGLAMAVKQTPWLLAPFLLAGIVLEARTHLAWPRAVRVGLRYMAFAVTGFLLPNLAYFVAAPGAWIHGVLTPFSASVVPAGQGVIALSMFLGIGGGSITAYSAVSIAALCGLFVLYVTTYPLGRPVTFLLPSMALFFATRSFGSYLVALVPIALLAAVTTEKGAVSGGLRLRASLHRGARAVLESRNRRRAVLGAAVLVPAGAIAFALASSPPLSITVTGVRTTGQLATVEQLTVEAANRTSAGLRPHFTVDEGGAVTSFWQVAQGPRQLAPHAKATYVLRAPNFPAQPPISGGFQVVAFTTRPASVSESPPYLPDTEHLSLNPDAFDSPIPLGKQVVVTAQLLDQLDRPIREAGIPVYLGQIIYDQLGLEYGEAVINGGPPGETPVTAYTDASGLATFTIVGTQVSNDPISLEANLVNPNQFYPYGYSQIVALRFRKAP